MFFNNKQKCYMGGTQHKFEERYDEEPSGYKISSKQCDPDSFRELIIVKKYVKDICVWCGKEIRRK